MVKLFSGENDQNKCERYFNFAERAVRTLAIQAKAVIQAYYGRPPQYSYWSGCSTGGFQGLVAVQQFPEAYDGLIIVAPAINWDRFIPSELWPQIVMHRRLGLLSAKRS